MTIALWCVLAVALLPLVCTGIAKSGFKEFDNNNPRAWLARQQGFRARANAAQQNSWEALGMFSAAVFAAQLAHAAQGRTDVLALAFVATRLAYIGCYLADRATLRSFVFMAGLGLTVAIFLFAA